MEPDLAAGGSAGGAVPKDRIARTHADLTAVVKRFGEVMFGAQDVAHSAHRLDRPSGSSRRVPD